MSGLCFGRILHIFRDGDWYQLSTDLLHGKEVGVPGDMMDKNVPIAVNDEVRITYTINEDEELDSNEQASNPIKILRVIPIQVEGIGLVTQIDNGFTLDDKYHLPRNVLEKNCSADIDSVIEFKAVKCYGASNPYRCTWAALLSHRREKNLFSLHLGQEMALNRVRDRNLGVRVLEADLQFLVTEGQISEYLLEKSLTLTNMSSRVPVKITAIKIIGLSLSRTENSQYFKLVSPVLEGTKGLELGCESSIQVVVRAFRQMEGIYSQNIVIEFTDSKIVRNIRMICGSEAFIHKYSTAFLRSDEEQDDPELLLYKLQCSTQIRLKRPAAEIDKDQTEATAENKLISKMRKVDEKWLIPKELQNLLLNNIGVWRDKLTSRFPYVYAPLSPDNYMNKWHYCIYVEEAELFLTFQNRSQRNVIPRRAPEECHYLIRVPDLEEARPSLMVYDKVIFILSSEKEKFVKSTEKTERLSLSKATFYGMIIKLCAEEVVVRLEQPLPTDVAFDVSFTFCRNQIIWQHSALERMGRTYRWKCLFPDHFPEKPPLPPNLNVEIAPNGRLSIQKPGEAEKKWLTLTRPNFDASQRRVIRNILRGDHRALPYLIRGPPGTGKTTTLVEIILQLILHDDQSKILVCTQSNSAANLILEKLVESELLSKDGELLRILGCNAYNCAAEIDPKLWPYMGTFQLCDDMELSSSVLENIKTGLTCAYLTNFRVIVTTTGLVPQLVDHGVSSKLFTHLFVDEAGQCLEVDVLAAIGLMENDRSQIVLVGDDKQLGPVVLCKDLDGSNYNESLFERLMNVKMYTADAVGFNEELSNQLNYNYRSVPSILMLFNDLFYDSKLRAMVPEDYGAKIEMLKHLQSVLPSSEERKKTMGVIFYSVLGVQQRSATSPSWLNPLEANVIVTLLQSIVNSGVSESDIGVIAPYQGQVRFIARGAAKRGLKDVKVGSVELFQGQEKPVILLSAVRSGEVPFNFGGARLGFVKNPKRLNVALSRAQSLLIIVGNPICLKMDRNWQETINYCMNRGAYVATDEELLKILKRNK